MLKNKNNKKCTIIYPVKNDNYNKYFLSRLNYVIEHTCALINELKLKNFFELNVVDFGSEKKFSKNLQISQPNIDIVSFYEIENSLTKNITKKKYGYFSQPLAINVALRRLESEYLIFTSHDLIFSKLSLINLYNFLEYKIIDKQLVENSFINVQRYFLPEDLTRKTPSFKFLNEWLTKYNYLNGDIGVTTGSAFAAHLASKKVWKQIRGINERFEGYGFMDPDLHSRANMIVPYYNSSRFGFHMYKIHRGYNNNRTNLLKFMNKNWTSLNFQENDINWGIGNLKISKIFIEKSKKINEINFKLTDFKLYNFKKIFFLNIFLVPIKLKIFLISLTDIKIVNTISLILKYLDLRNFIFIGYNSPFLILYLLKLKQSSNLMIYDNLKKVVSENKKLNLLNKNKLIHGLNFDRSSKLGEAKTINSSNLINHQGYFRNINSFDDMQIKEIFNQIYSEDDQTFLVIIESQISNIILFNEEIKKNINLIAGALIIKNSNNSNILNTFISDKFQKKILSKDVCLVSKIQIKDNNFSKIYYDFVIINLILYFCNSLRLFKSLLWRLKRLFSIKNFRNLGG